MTQRDIFKNKTDYDRYSCVKGAPVHILNDPVQLSCGHRLCRACADDLVAASKNAAEHNPTTASLLPISCPAPDCNDPLDEDDGHYVT